jgi:hypothetical protein
MSFSLLSPKTKEATQKTWNAMKRSMPILLGVLLLITLIIEIIPKNIYGKVFTGHVLLDPLLGAIFGSIAAGNPLNSYVIGGELISQGVSLVAITAFILSWVTVGLVQLPAESLMLGRKFAISRNIFSFLSAIIIAILTAYTFTIL